MALDPNSRDTAVVTAAMAIVATLLAVLAMPNVADAALRRAAGGASGGDGGFARFVQFIDRLADYTIPIGSAFAVLGLIWGGLLFQAGDTRAGRVLGFVVLGVGVVLLSKPIAARCEPAGHQRSWPSSAASWRRCWCRPRPRTPLGFRGSRTRSTSACRARRT